MFLFWHFWNSPFCRRKDWDGVDLAFHRRVVWNWSTCWLHYDSVWNIHKFKRKRNKIEKNTPLGVFFIQLLSFHLFKFFLSDCSVKSKFVEFFKAVKHIVVIFFGSTSVFHIFLQNCSGFLIWNYCTLYYTNMLTW